jgi:hypothetical protein
MTLAPLWLQALLSEIARARRDAQRATSHRFSKIFSSSTTATSRPSAAAAALAEELDVSDCAGADKASLPAAANDVSYQPSISAAGR